MAEDDPYRWLEDVDGAEAMAWVHARNAETVAALDDHGTARLSTALREVLDHTDRLRYPTWRGTHVYDFLQDAAHPKGLWRRAELAAYTAGQPHWQTLLDVDALAAAEAENWVWSGASVLAPSHDRCLISLSRGGADAVVVREFDLVEQAFVADGFALPEAKTAVGWIDADHVFVGTDFGPGSLTTSGYRRVFKRWRRGTPLTDAVTVFEGETADVLVTARHDPTPGYERDFVGRRLDFFRTVDYLLGADGLRRIDVPEDADWDVHRQWLLVRPRTPWTVGEVTYPAGALLATHFDDFLDGGRDLTVLFEPDPRTVLRTWTWTRHHLIVDLLRDVTSRLQVLTPGDDGWSRGPLPGTADTGHAEIVDTDPEQGDGYLLATTGFLQPSALSFGVVGEQPRTLHREPDLFDTAGMQVRQHFATSSDGTRVPYFVVGDPAAPAGPTLLHAYGGFELSRTPAYDAVTGRGWLARGGRYVLANIRGGGEYGPAWHRAAMRDNRPRAFEDLAAVAEDLTHHGLTGPAHLGVDGGSNGGLLAGAMLTRHPHLFGAVVIRVPLLDMLRYHRLLAGASWIAEYGDPDDPADREFLRAYSPYHNIRPGWSYPPVLLTTSTRDDRVHPGHARKMAALLREHGYDVTYYENVDGGHGGAADNAQRARLAAMRLEFLWRALSGSGVPRQTGDRAAPVTAA